MAIVKMEQVAPRIEVGSQLTLEEFANILHREEDAFVTVATKTQQGVWTERNYKVKEWFNHVTTDVDKSCYSSVNTFYKRSRSNQNARHLNALFVDLDVYNENISKLDAINGIDFLVEKEILLEPTFIVDSGRGLYAIWKIESVPGRFQNAQKLYSHVQEYLIENMKDLGADPKAKDIARVLRVPGSFNAKSDSVVEILEYSEKTYTLRLFQELMNDVNAVDWSIETKKLAEKPKRQKRNPGRIKRLFNFYTLAISRSRDLEMICVLRDYDIKGSRNTLLHIYAYQMMLIHKDLNVAKDVTKSLNEKLVEPLSNQEITVLCRSVYKAYQNHLKDKVKGYNYKNETIIERLRITAAEQKNMKTLIETREKYNRNNERRTPRNADNLTPRQAQKKELIRQVQSLVAQGLKQIQIAKKLGVTRGRVSQIIKGLRNV